MSSTGLLRGFEVDELSCGEDDGLLSGTGEAIGDDLIGVAVVRGRGAEVESSQPQREEEHFRRSRE
jgi:hypothetical protein